jgi:hypothetical protein
MRLRLVGTLNDAGAVAFSGHLSTRQSWEVTLTNRILPPTWAFGVVGIFVVALISPAAAFFPFVVALQAGFLYLLMWYGLHAGRPARAVEVARLLMVIGDATHGVVDVESRRLHGVGRIFEPTVLDVPGPMISKAMTELIGGNSRDHTPSTGRRLGDSRKGT